MVHFIGAGSTTYTNNGQGSTPASASNLPLQNTHTNNRMQIAASSALQNSGESSASEQTPQNSIPKSKKVDRRLIDLSQQMNPYANDGQAGLVESIYQNFFATNPKLKPNAYIYNIRIKAYAKNKQVDIALALAEEMNTNNLSWDIYTYHSLIDGLCKSNRADEGLKLFKSIPKDLTLGINTYNALIDGLQKAGRTDDAIMILELMIAANLQPDVVTFNCLAHSLCKKDRIQETALIFKQMEAVNVQPDVVTLTTMITGLCKLGQAEDAEKLLKQMEETNIKPNIVTYNTLLLGFCKIGKVKEAIRLVENMPPHIKPNVVTYNTLIEGLKTAKITEETEQLLQVMEAAKIQPDVITYTTMIDALCKEGKPAEASQMLQNMPEDVKPNIVTFNAMLDGLSKAKNSEEIQQILRQMETANIEPDIVTFNTFVDRLCKERKAKEAQQLLEKLPSNLKPDIVTFNTLIDGLSHAGKPWDAVLILQHMANAKVQPDVVTHGLVINAYIMCSHIGFAKRYYRANFSQDIFTPKTIDLHDHLSVGAGFIKVLLFLEWYGRNDRFTVIAGWGKHNKHDQVQKMFNFVKMHLESHYENLGKQIEIQAFDHNNGRFAVYAPKK